MKDNTKSQNDLKRLLETSDYNDIRVYLKQQKYLSKQSVAKTFWQSSLPINWFSELSKELFFEQLLFSYFKAGTNANDLFLKCFLNSTKKNFTN